MIKITPYSDVSIQQFYNGLLLKQKNNVHFEFEIRVDNEQIIPRNSDVNNFFSFEKFMSSKSENVEIFLYKGTSRRYDKYVFEKQIIQNTEIDINARINEGIKKVKKEMEFQQLTEKLKFYKNTNKDLKERIKYLESDSQNSNSMQDLVKILSQTNILQKITGNKTEPLNGVKAENAISEQPYLMDGFSNSELIELVHSFKTELGEETFQALLGISLMLGKTPSLIPMVRKLIEKSINKT